MRISDWEFRRVLFRSSLGLFQHAIEVMQHQQPRRLVGVEGGLQVDLGACAGLPEAVHHQLTGGAGAGGEEGQAGAARGHRKILYKGQGRAARGMKSYAPATVKTGRKIRPEEGSIGKGREGKRK